MELASVVCVVSGAGVRCEDWLGYLGLVGDGRAGL
jgi:hypothetical protein